MSEKPGIAIRVKDLDTSVRWYADRLGCAIISHRVTADRAVVAYHGYLLLLAGPEVGNLAPLLTPIHQFVGPEETVFLDGGSVNTAPALRHKLASRGLTDVTVIERPWGDSTLTIIDPDGYRITFWFTAEHTPEETQSLYHAGPGALDAALSDLSDDQLDLAQRPGGWTIRHIVHHLVDTEATVLGRPMFAIAEPGRVYVGNVWSQDIWAAGLDYEHRDIATSVALFRAIRAHISHLLGHIPDAWTRTTVDDRGDPSTVGVAIAMLVSHACAHIEQITEIRAAHGISE